jgi:hypothetical protein
MVDFEYTNKMHKYPIGRLFPQQLEVYLFYGCTCPVVNRSPFVNNATKRESL